jgi:enamine deaminase RidA (YjgF/YER057c/UK114 family)
MRIRFAELVAGLPSGSRVLELGAGPGLLAECVLERCANLASYIMRKLVSSGSPYEPKVGISRAVRVGNIVAVSGTAPLGPDGRTIGQGDAAAQARRCLEIIKEALERAGASLDQVVRTRTLVTRIEDWQAVASVHGEFFGNIRPANTIMQVSRFIDPDWLVELEADAVVEE